ncbi:Hypothetical predicted protein, partial [Marmota monax]
MPDQPIEDSALDYWADRCARRSRRAEVWRRRLGGSGPELLARTARTPVFEAAVGGHRPTG